MSKPVATRGLFFEKRALPIKGRFFRDLEGRDDGMFMNKGAGVPVVNAGGQPPAKPGDDSSKLNVGATGAPMGGSGFRGQGMGGGMYGTGDGCSDEDKEEYGTGKGKVKTAAPDPLHRAPMDSQAQRSAPVMRSAPAKGFDSKGKYDPTAGQGPIDPYTKSKENPTGGEKPKQKPKQKPKHHSSTAKRSTVADPQPAAAGPVSEGRRAQIDKILASKNSSSADDPLDLYQASMGVTEKPKGSAGKPVATVKTHGASAAAKPVASKPSTVRDLPGSAPNRSTREPAPETMSRREPAPETVSRRQGAPWQLPSGWGSAAKPASQPAVNSSTYDDQDFGGEPGSTVNGEPGGPPVTYGSSPLTASKTVKGVSQMAGTGRGLPKHAGASPTDWDADTSLPTGFHRPAKEQPEALEGGGERFHSTEDGTVIPPSNRQRHGLVEGGSMTLRATASPQMGKHASVSRFMGTSYGIEKSAYSTDAWGNAKPKKEEASAGGWLGARAGEFGHSLQSAAGGVGDFLNSGVKAVTRSPGGATLAAIIAAGLGVGGAKRLMRLGGGGAAAAAKAKAVADAAKAAKGGGIISKLMGGAAKAVAGARNFVTK